jgi:beta-galactosidase
VTWDSYPLGFTDTTLGIGELFTDKQKITYARTGHPDLASFHHDLYRAVGNGSFWIMEQQPGMINTSTNYSK